MTLMTLGLALWWLAHLFKRLAPGPRAALGDAGKGGVALALALSVVLMVLGYRGAEVVPLWEPPAFLRHVNNLLMVLAFYCYAASGMKTALTRYVRHPQLLGFSLWAVAHLLVNGDRASVVVFGGLLVWAGLTVLLINRAVPRSAPPLPASMGKEIGAALGAVLVTGVVGMIHGWLGPWPFG